MDAPSRGPQRSVTEMALSFAPRPLKLEKMNKIKVTLLTASALTLFAIQGCEKNESGFALREHKVGLYFKGTSEGDRLGVFDGKTPEKAMSYCQSLLRPLQESKQIESDLKEAQCLPIK